MRREIKRLTFCIASVLAVYGYLAGPALALDASKLPEGANHARAHRYATGAGVTVGVFDTVPYGILSPNHLGSRLLAQYSFVGKTPSQSPDPLVTFADDHERLAANIVAGDDPVHTGVAPAALVYDIAIDSTSFDSRRAASAWMVANHDVSIFSLSASFGTNTNGTSVESLYWDWLMHEKNALVVVAAGNTGGQIGIPADSYNGITVGAYDQADLKRASFSAYFVNGGGEGSEVRGKPDILAPGVWVGDGISYGGFYSAGTSFATPHVTGAAALLTDFAARHPAADVLHPRGIKALVLNSARKRQIVGPELASPVTSDYSVANSSFDQDYLDCSLASCSIRDSVSAGATDSWTPAEWSYSAGRFSVAKPLDDEQGAGYLDATRAIINLAGGNAAPGLVRGIGWDQATIAPTDSAAMHSYVLDQALAAGSFLTATLVWDRIVVEGDGNGIVDDVDDYSFGELANLDLRVLDAANAVIAESISTTDNVEHLHVPLPADAAPGAYKLQVSYTGSGALATDFALAWWTDPTPLVPGDYDLDGTVDAADYQEWRTNFGDSTAVSPLVHGDGNADGSVDAADYAVWRNHLGESWTGLGGGSVASLAVPEVNTLSLVAAGILWLGALPRASDRNRMKTQIVRGKKCCATLILGYANGG